MLTESIWSKQPKRDQSPPVKLKKPGNNRWSFLIIYVIYRCFPHCKSSGHSEVGFCGAPVVVVLDVPIDLTSPTCHKFDNFWIQNQYVAEIKCKDARGFSSDIYVSKHSILSQIRSKAKKCNPYIAGRCVSIETCFEDGVMFAKKITIEFNSDRHAWHYGWVSHKNTRFKSHVLEITVLVERNQSKDTYFVAASFESPEFTVSCTKGKQLSRKQTRICQECTMESHYAMPRAKRVRVHEGDAPAYPEDDDGCIEGLDFIQGTTYSTDR